MRRGGTAALVVVAVLLVLAVVGDRAVARAAEAQVTAAVEQQLPGATGVSTRVAGVPVLTQVAAGRLREVTVTADTVPSHGVTLDDVVVDVHDVTTSAPHTASSVHATASLSSATLQAQLGPDWQVRTDGAAIVATWTGLLSAEARVVPEVSGGALTLRLESVSVLGVTVDGSSVPSAVTDRIDALAASLGRLPLGLHLTGVRVTPSGVDVTADGQDVALG